MHCCVCSGVCYHIGGPWYCERHGGASQWVNPPYTDMPVSPMPVIVPLTCAHCYCKHDGTRHKVCCNCGNRQLTKKVTDG